MQSEGSKVKVTKGDSSVFKSSDRGTAEPTAAKLSKIPRGNSRIKTKTVTPVNGAGNTNLLG